MEQFQNFRIYADLIQGESHLKSGVPCQDSIEYITSPDYIIMAQSDGVSMCRYSHMGSQLMVTFAVKAAKNLVPNWREVLARELKTNPTSMGAVKALLSGIRLSILLRLKNWATAYCSDSWARVDPNLMITAVTQYLQATLNIVIMTPEFTIVAGVGDGNWDLNATWTERDAISSDPNGENKPNSLAYALLPEDSILDKKGKPRKLDTSFEVLHFGATSEVTEIGLASDGKQHFDKMAKRLLVRNDNQPHGTLDQFWTGECQEDPSYIRTRINIITFRNSIWHGDDVSFVVAKRYS